MLRRFWRKCSESYFTEMTEASPRDDFLAAGFPVRVEGRWEGRGVLVFPHLLPGRVGEGLGPLSSPLDAQVRCLLRAQWSVVAPLHLVSLCCLSSSSQTPQSKGFVAPKKESEIRRPPGDPHFPRKFGVRLMARGKTEVPGLQSPNNPPRCIFYPVLHMRK